MSDHCLDSYLIMIDIDSYLHIFSSHLFFYRLLYEIHETQQLQNVIQDLLKSSDDDGSHGASESARSTNLMEIYALQIQLYSRLKDNKQLRRIFHTAMHVQGGVPHPRTIALIQELGGKMHMASREFEVASKTFFHAFKSYDDAGDPARLRCLKYLVMASMLHASSINPFDSQEARPYRDDPEIVAMTKLVQAFHNNEIRTFERILQRNEGRIMDDEFVREHIEDLLRTIRTQVLRQVIRPYTRISLNKIARELNDIPVADVESLLVDMVLDGKLHGKIDQIEGVLVKDVERVREGGGNDTAGDNQVHVIGSGADDLISMDGNVPSRSGQGFTKEEYFQLQNCDAIDKLTQTLEDLAMGITSGSGKNIFQQIL